MLHSAPMRTTLFLFAALLPAADYPVAVDNERVKVLIVTNRPGQKSQPHRHDVNRVMIHLDAGRMKLAFEKGEVKDIRFHAGEVRWDLADGVHTSENMGSSAFRIVEVELKRPKGAPFTPPARDTIKVDPKHYKLLFENDQVRVIRARYGPRESAPTHEHALPRVIVNLTRQAVRTTMPDGSTGEIRKSAGEVTYSAGGATHSEVNLLDQPFEVAVVELK